MPSKRIRNAIRHESPNTYLLDATALAVVEHLPDDLDNAGTEHEFIDIRGTPGRDRDTPSPLLAPSSPPAVVSDQPAAGAPLDLGHVRSPVIARCVVSLFDLHTPCNAMFVLPIALLISHGVDSIHVSHRFLIYLFRAVPPI